jgi:hypothetical protein
VPPLAPTAPAQLVVSRAADVDEDEEWTELEEAEARPMPVAGSRFG